MRTMALMKVISMGVRTPPEAGVDHSHKSGMIRYKVEILSWEEARRGGRVRRDDKLQ